MCRRVVGRLPRGLHAADPRQADAQRDRASPSIAKAAADGGADAISLINTCLGMAIDWRRRRPLLGNVLGGLSGPAIKPIALRAVYQVAQAVEIAAHRHRRHRHDRRRDGVSRRRRHGRSNRHGELLQSHGVDDNCSTQLPAALAELGAERLTDVVGTLRNGVVRG